MIPRKFIFILPFLLLLSVFSYGQIEVNKCKGELKAYTFYVAIEDTSDAGAKLFMDKLKESWTVSKLAFFKGNDHSDLSSILRKDKDALFLRIQTDYQTSRLNSNNNFTAQYINTFLQLWQPKKLKYVSDTRVTYSDYVIASIALFDSTGFKGSTGNFANLNYGFMLNYLNIVQRCIKGNIRTGYFFSTLPRNLVALNNLKTNPVYIPEYAFLFSNHGVYTDRDADALMKEYPYKYERINQDELGNKILTSKEDFYYLVYIKNCTDKFIMIINGNTGELLYTVYKAISYNMNSTDLKNLARAIDKAGK